VPEYKCVNVGSDECPVWLTLTDKITIVSVSPPTYLEGVGEPAKTLVVKAVVTLVTQGQTIEVKSPMPVESVCRILGFVWDEKDVVAEPAPPEAAKSEAVAIDPKTGKPEGEPH